MDRHIQSYFCMLTQTLAHSIFPSFSYTYTHTHTHTHTHTATTTKPDMHVQHHLTLCHTKVISHSPGWGGIVITGATPVTLNKRWWPEVLQAWPWRVETLTWALCSCSITLWRGRRPIKYYTPCFQISPVVHWTNGLVSPAYTLSCKFSVWVSTVEDYSGQQQEHLFYFLFSTHQQSVDHDSGHSGYQLPCLKS